MGDRLRLGQLRLPGLQGRGETVLLGNVARQVLIPDREVPGAVGDRRLELLAAGLQPRHGIPALPGQRTHTGPSAMAHERLEGE
jgi:hypothetical protein